MIALIVACAFLAATPASERRSEVIAHAQLWAPTNIRSIDIKTGPQGPGIFPFGSTVNCQYLDQKLSGRSPKFACQHGDDELKVKFGGNNGEVYAEVAATRLLWALGFGADRMYPVKVVCRGCPSLFGGIENMDGTWLFDPASIERKMEGVEFDAEQGWSWQELEQIDESKGGATRAQRDALKLLAVFIQHTDNKPQQQRLLCLDQGKSVKGACEHPFMLLNDVGVTFGRANIFNANAAGAMNLAAWSKEPIWKGSEGCIGNLRKSATGTLGDPIIREEGRQFLSDLLGQLSDTQIQDLFSVARVNLRLRDPGNPLSGVFATPEEWTAVFKKKRDEIANRHCSTS
jgi:hypothetical protein